MKNNRVANCISNTYVYRWYYMYMYAHIRALKICATPYKKGSFFRLLISLSLSISVPKPIWKTIFAPFHINYIILSWERQLSRLYILYIHQYNLWNTMKKRIHFQCLRAAYNYFARTMYLILYKRYTLYRKKYPPYS